MTTTLASFKENLEKIIVQHEVASPEIIFLGLKEDDSIIPYQFTDRIIGNTAVLLLTEDLEKGSGLLPGCDGNTIVDVTDWVKDLEEEGIDEVSVLIPDYAITDAGFLYDGTYIVLRLNLSDDVDLLLASIFESYNFLALARLEQACDEPSGN